MANTGFLDFFYTFSKDAIPEQFLCLRSKRSAGGFGGRNGIGLYDVVENRLGA